MFLRFPKLTPEAVMMLSLAALLDSAGVILLCLGLDDFSILDFIGMATIGTWMIFKLGKVKKPTGSGNFLKKVFTGKYSKFLVTFGIEEIPYLGGLSFTWTAAVYFTLIVQDEQRMQAERMEQLLADIEKQPNIPSGPPADAQSF